MASGGLFYSGSLAMLRGESYENFSHRFRYAVVPFLGYVSYPSMLGVARLLYLSPLVRFLSSGPPTSAYCALSRRNRRTQVD